MHGEKVDVEALQAQIDLSNSVTYDLVSSWMNPASSNTPSTSVSSSIARGLEEHAKRPPRLGLGASMSKASVATAREAAKLKGKLAGTKRARDDGGGSATRQAQEEEDDGESRSAAISRKKFKVNGTGGLALGHTKKDKRKGKAVQTSESNGLVTETAAPTEEGAQEKKRKEKHQEDGTQEKKRKEKHQEEHIGPPSQPNKLFNLDGPPVPNTETEDAEERGSGSLKRKKRRRRGKKKSHANGGGE